ncbi:hypothetical protein ACS0TY_027717 [Phlomoides rotata]
MHQTVVIVALITAFLVSRGGGGYRSRRPRRRFSMIDRIPNQVSNMHRLVEISDEVCKDQLRMDRISFVRLCFIKYVFFPCMYLLFITESWANLYFFNTDLSMDAPADGPKNDKRKSSKTRRVWTQKEEEALIKCLKEIIPQGWKADNGFKVGYLRELEKGLNMVFPGTDLRPYPHIHSKLHVWKKDYSTIVSMLSKSGIGWDNTSKMIDVEQEEAWEAYKKVDVNARTMRNKPWPYYDDWCEIFGKDRATGEHAEDIMDAVNNMNSSNTPSETGSQFNGPINDLGDDTENNENTSVCHAEGEDTPRSGKRVRKRPSLDGETSSIITTLGGFLENTESRLGEIAQRIGYEQDVAMSRKEVFQIIDTVEGLNIQQKLRVSEYFVLSNERLELFLSLPESARNDYVHMVHDDLK